MDRTRPTPEREPGYTHLNLSEVPDSAPRFGFGELGEARFARGALQAERTGVSFHRLKPGKRQAFGHRHVDAEEVYVVIAGSGRVKLDAEIVELSPLDALRVAPSVVRSFEAGPDGMDLLAVGQHHERDGEVLPGWW